jgi:P4 family phage/plasmid primase-like protien
MSDLLTAALAYAARGWHVFPLVPMGKEPWKGSRGFKDGTTDEGQIRRWWDIEPASNIGISCGYSGLCVVDVDPGGDEVLEALGIELPPTTMVVTARGAHHYYAAPEPIQLANKWHQSVDVKALDGYVVAPPSVHPTGDVYTWDEPDEKPGELSPVPDVVMRDHRAVVARKAAAAPVVLGKAGEDWTDELRARLVDALDHVEADDYDRWVAIGAALHLASGGDATGLDLWDTWSQTASNYEPGATGKRWSGFRHEVGNPATLGKIVALAREGGWAGSLPLSSEYKAQVAAVAEQGSGGGLVLPFARGDEQEIAEHVLNLAEEGGEPLRFDRQVLWAYDPSAGRWGKADEAALQNSVGQLAGRRVCAPRKDDPTATKPLRVGSAFRAGVYKIACMERAAPGFFDEAAPGVAFADRFVSVRDGKLVQVEHSPDHRVRHGFAFQWDPLAECPLWTAALGKWFGEGSAGQTRAQLLQEFVGACLMGVATQFDRALVLSGDGENGKSVCLQVIEALFAPEQRTALAPQKFAIEHHLAELDGALVNIANEIPRAGIIDSASFKAIITGERVTAARKFERSFNFEPKAGHLYAANELPATRDQSRGFWRRWIVLPFNLRIAEADQIKDLERKIIGGELRGVVAWAIAGAERVMARGKYIMPDGHDEAVTQWRQDADSVAAWCAEQCSADGESDLAALYTSYGAWARDNGHGTGGHGLTSRKFAKRLRRLGHESRRADGKTLFPLKAPIPFWSKAQGGAG